MSTQKQGKNMEKMGKLKNFFDDAPNQVKKNMDLKNAKFVEKSQDLRQIQKKEDNIKGLGDKDSQPVNVANPIFGSSGFDQEQQQLSRSASENLNSGSQNSINLELQSQSKTEDTNNKNNNQIQSQKQFDSKRNSLSIEKGNTNNSLLQNQSYSKLNPSNLDGDIDENQKQSLNNEIANSSQSGEFNDNQVVGNDSSNKNTTEQFHNADYNNNKQDSQDGRNSTQKSEKQFTENQIIDEQGQNKSDQQFYDSQENVLNPNNSKYQAETEFQDDQDLQNSSKEVRNQFIRQTASEEFISPSPEQSHDSNYYTAQELEIIKQLKEHQLKVDQQLKNQPKKKSQKQLVNEDENSYMIQFAEEKKRELEKKLKGLEDQIKVLSNNAGNQQKTDQSLSPGAQLGNAGGSGNNTKAGNFLFKNYNDISDDQEAREKALEFVKKMNHERREKKIKQKLEKDTNEMYDNFMRESLQREDARKQIEKEQKREKIQKKLQDIEKRKKQREQFIKESEKVISEIKIDKQDPMKQFQDEFEMPELVKRKQELAQKREMNKVDFEEITEFSQKHGEEVKIKQMQKENLLKNSIDVNLDMDLQPYQFKKSKFTQEYLQRKKQDKMVEERKQEEIRQRVMKKHEYAQIVKQVFEPKIQLRQQNNNVKEYGNNSILSNQNTNPEQQHHYFDNQNQSPGKDNNQGYHEPGMVINQSDQKIKKQLLKNYKQQQSPRDGQQKEFANSNEYQLAQYNRTNQSSIEQTQKPFFSQNIREIPIYSLRERNLHAVSVAGTLRQLNHSGQNSMDLNTEKPTPDTLLSIPKQYLPVHPNTTSNGSELKKIKNKFMNSDQLIRVKNDNFSEDFRDMGDERSSKINTNLPSVTNLPPYYPHNNIATNNNYLIRQPKIFKNIVEDEDQNIQTNNFPKQPNYLLELRKHREEKEKKTGQKGQIENWEKYKENQNMSEQDKYNYILRSANKLENAAQFKEQIAQKHQDPDMQDQVNSLYVDSIKAQLALLEKY